MGGGTDGDGVPVAVAQSLGQVGDALGLIGNADEHCVLLDWVPSGVVQDVQRSLVLINDKGDYANVINFLGVECLDVDFVPGKGKGKVGSQSVVIFRDDGNLFHGLERFCNVEPIFEPCPVLFRWTNRFASEDAQVKFRR